MHTFKPAVIQYLTLTPYLKIMLRRLYFIYSSPIWLYINRNSVKNVILYQYYHPMLNFWYEHWHQVKLGKKLKYYWTQLKRYFFLINVTYSKYDWLHYYTCMFSRKACRRTWNNLCRRFFNSHLIFRANLWHLRFNLSCCALFISPLCFFIAPVLRQCVYFAHFLWN